MFLHDGRGFGGGPFQWIRSDGAGREARIRRALDQLSSALSALHRAGFAHCDIKPPNVRVKEDGTVVLLDLGLATPIRRFCRPVRDRNPNAGTPSYVAPEQVGGALVTEAADLYSLGVVLFELLTGRLPFVGNADQVLVSKQLFEAEWPRGIEAPPDLKAVCMSLLRIDTEARLRVDEIRRTLRFDPLLPAEPFVGRNKELDALRGHLGSPGGFTAVVVEGESGIGKTSLVEAFLAEREATLVLRARCFEREVVSYNALDGIADDLSRVLDQGSLEDALVDASPDDRAMLRTVFPVFRQPDELPERPLRDPVRVRAHAVEGLRHILAWLADSIRPA